MPPEDLSLSYQTQLDEKVAVLSKQLQPFYTQPLEVFDSPPEHYRQRAEFKIWHDQQGIHYAMYRPGTKSLYTLQQFPTACRPINELMPPLLEALCCVEVLRNRLFSVEFLATLKGDLLVTTIYHKPLSDDWEQAASDLQSTLRDSGFKLSIIGRSRKQKRVLAKDHLTESLQVNGQTYLTRQNEGAFTQPNAEVCQKMLAWAQQKAAEAQADHKDLLELYCGNGNFTLPLSRYFRRVLTTEISKTSIAALNWAIGANQCTNITCARLSAEEICDALDGVRAFRRLAQIDLTEYDFGTLFVDPPRAGMDARTCKFASRFDRILYVSCNPETLVENLEQLSNTHRVTSAALFDQFPFTRHTECGVVLMRNTES